MLSPPYCLQVIPSKVGVKSRKESALTVFISESCFEIYEKFQLKILFMFMLLMFTSDRVLFFSNKYSTTLFVSLFICLFISEIAAGSIVDCLVGFTNNGKGDFVIKALEASLRYPQDYSYFIQNVS